MNENRPFIKRVVNVGQMRFQSLNQSKTETKNSQYDYDLHKLNSTKSISYLQNINKSINENQLTSYMMYQTSELDLEDNFQIQKNNPIFLNENAIEDSINDSKINKEKSVLKIGVNSLTNERVIKDSKIDESLNVFNSKNLHVNDNFSRLSIKNINDTISSNQSVKNDFSGNFEENYSHDFKSDKSIKCFYEFFSF
jgi:hypothetical protein